MFVANREADSLTVFAVDGGHEKAAKGNSNILTKLAEVPVGEEPVCVAADGERAFVVNAVSGTVSVVQRTGKGFEETAEFAVGTEPRGCALTGTRLYVTNYTEGTVAIVDTKKKKVVDTVKVGGNPYGITVVGHDVFVTQFFARLLRNRAAARGSTMARKGWCSTSVATTLTWTRSRSRRSPIPGSLRIGSISASSSILWLRTTPSVRIRMPRTAMTPLLRRPWQAYTRTSSRTALACDGLLYLPNVGAQPEPPVAGGLNFDTNVQALVHVVDIASRTEREDLTVNLNQQINTEQAPNPVQGSLAKLFGNEIVAMDADDDCENFFILSRGGNFVLKAQLVDGKLDIGAPNNVIRFQTGNIPTGIVVDEEGQLGFVNNQVNMSVSVLDLKATGPDNVIARDVDSSTPPEPGTFDHTRIVGQLKFFTALGVPDNGLVGLPVRDIIPVDFRGKQSQDAWSSCGSCHDEGLADGVTWIFGDGPRQTLPMDGLYSKVNGAHDIRINNWSAARDSGTDFNQNSVGVQGGDGFASDPFARPIPTSSITASRRAPARRWTSRPPGLQTIRTLNAPQPEDPATWRRARPFSTRTARPATAAPSGPRARCSTPTIPGSWQTPPLAACPAIRAWRSQPPRSSRTPISTSSRIRCVPGAEHRRVRSGQSDRDPAERQSVARRARPQRAVLARGRQQRALLPQRPGADARGGVRDPPTSGRRHHRRSGRRRRPARLRQGDRRHNGALPLGSL